MGGKLLIGWQEWVALPTLNIPAIKAKVDTGAKTSSLHAYDITPFVSKGVDYVRFNLHPIQGNNRVNVCCEAPVFDCRGVMSSNGSIEHRFVIKSHLKLGPLKWEIEITLSNRDPLRFRMLLGRQALRAKALINPGHQLYWGKFSKKDLKELYS